MTISTEAITEEVKTNGQWVHAVQSEISRVIVGQKYLIDRLLIGLLANGHVLLEGVPGLAKTLAVKTLASCIGYEFSSSPIHTGPVAGGHHRDDDLQSA